ncbi:TetR/AcrR family transcriptional regulator [Streptantibioticus silvisoli]|uniref:TetR family transcriptional regulator n=1 Tax=Streptantibioticus silvisoli TaxID=2705255 RepID=A0ABT6VSJ9_9ACTN|nr:TetR family transcriptional regulator [Streptantibioticus silvisoli]MDI5961453.1 TetR family transcriptional regulator [Streptantibioticus silvisoli]
MPPDVLTPERILEATEDVLRRFGPAKATVVDVARALGVSHGSVYRHFPSKVALREAVTGRWLERAHGELAGIASAAGPAPERLAAWLGALFAAKRRKALGDPELFATYRSLFGEHSAVVRSHLADLCGQLRVIIEDGAARGEFAADGPAADPATAAQAVFDATVRFHDPVHAAHWSAAGIEEAHDAVVALVLRGLSAR